ncbi:MAG: Fic family protein [Oscillospiraceae bacterium]|nr:Fic family protein [Oscillospiraceae bacterium]
MINKLNITAANELESAERNITALRLLELTRNPIRGMFGFTHLCKIHRYVFGDVYEWAGLIREGEFLLKGDTLFCVGSHIPEYADNIFGKLKNDRFLRGMGKQEFVEKCAYYMAELNALHPFREGNGRTNRKFFRQLALKSGYSLQWQLADTDDLLRSDIAAFDKDYAPLIEILERIAGQCG